MDLTINLTNKTHSYVKGGVRIYGTSRVFNNYPFMGRLL